LAVVLPKVDAVAPLNATGVLGIVAEGIGHGFEAPELQAAVVLGEEEDVGATFVTNLGDELGEGGGAGKVDVGVRFAAVAVTAGDDGEAPGGGEGDDVAVFVPGPEAVQFKGVNPGAVTVEEAMEHLAMHLAACEAFVPEGMVADDEDLRDRMEGGQQLGESMGSGRRRPRAKPVHPGGGVSSGEVVDAEVEEGLGKGNGPFRRDGGDGVRAEDVEVEAGGDGIVIGKGDEGGQLEEILDLAALEGFGVGRGKRRGPPGAGVVEILAVVGEESRFVFTDGLADPRDTVRVARQEGHVLLRVHGVAVEGDTGPELVGNARVAPEEVKTMGGHGSQCADRALQRNENSVNSR
jgi:hypothetical protein